MQENTPDLIDLHTPRPAAAAGAPPGPDVVAHSIEYLEEEDSSEGFSFGQVSGGGDARTPPKGPLQNARPSSSLIDDDIFYLAAKQKGQPAPDAK
jgi:hypothetical protein